MDEVKVFQKEMIISAICHDILEDCSKYGDLSPELLEHCFGSEVVSIIKLLSKMPKDGYHDRLSNCHNWKILTIKMCDRLDNLRSLMIPGTTLEFQKKQVKETKEIYFPLFDQLLQLCPTMYLENISAVRDEIRRLIERYSTLIEILESTEINSTLNLGDVI
jgi:(p)ppGpp synthase/HD superfamily hydrolase